MEALRSASLLLLSLRLAASLPALSISGHSSGGDMAEQHFVAHSKDVVGLAHIAAAPYGCGATSAPFDTAACTSSGKAIDLAFLAAYTDSRPDIDDPSHMRGKPVYVFSGTSDATVPQSVVKVAAAYYQHYGAEVKTKFDLGAGHAFITDSYGNPCASTYAPFVNNCGYDMAGAALQHIYGDLKPKAKRLHLSCFVQVDQAKYGAGKKNGMGSAAFAYVPRSCAGRVAACRLHLVYHGCDSSITAIGDAIYKHAGYNQWADTNDIVVLYPQAHGYDCWDWTATYGEEFDTQKSVQLKVVNAMVEGLLTGDATVV